MGHCLLRRTITPAPLPESRPQVAFAEQLKLARVHPHLIALTRGLDGYEVDVGATRGAFELTLGRGLAGYGLARALRLILDALAGVSALHATRSANGTPFVHGELVPELLRVDAHGVTRVIPLAPWHWSKVGTLPLPQRWGHLAPERLLGDVIDARADVFSAGVLLWEALAGRLLFESESIDSIVMRLLGGKVTLPQLPPELGWAMPLKGLAMRALSVSPADRFATCAEFARAIEAVAIGRIATHAEVWQHFSARHHSVRPSLFPLVPQAPSHKSSLSGLVSPVQPVTDAPPAEPTAPSSAALPAQPGPELTAEIRPPRRRLVVALLTVAAAFAVGAAIRYQAARSSITVTASRGAPLALLPPVAPLIATPSGASRIAPAPPVPAALSAVPMAIAVPSADAIPSLNATRRSPPNAHKSLAPRPNVAAKPGRKPGKEGDQYGI